MKEFNNRENQCIIHEGKEYWISRSVALVAQVYFETDDGLFILTEKRGPAMDQPGKQCLVCGYLDWDETGWEGIKREIYEETSLDIDLITDHLITNNDKQPYFVRTDPKENRQNVSLNYIILYSGTILPDIGKFSSDEVEEVQWTSVKRISDFEWAFEHDRRIKSGLSFLEEKNLTPPLWFS